MENLNNAHGKSQPDEVNLTANFLSTHGSKLTSPLKSSTTSTSTNLPTTPSSIIIANGDSGEITGASTASVTFAGTTGTIKLDDSVAFKGQVSGLAGQDAIDLADVGFGANTKVSFSGDVTGGTLTVTDGTHTANIALEGNYLQSGWTLSSDGKGGTTVVDPVAADAWQRIDIGAGGWLTGIDIAPDGTMVVRTDTYGAYIWNGTAWQQLVTATSMPAQFVAPQNGQGVYEIQIASSNSNILYMMYEGYVFKSVNKGTNWTQTSFAPVTEDPNDAYRVNGQKMAVDPSNPNIVYVGTPQDGLFVTTDGGTTWSKVSAIPVSGTDSGGLYPGITGIEFVPSSGTVNGKTQTIFASSYGNGVYESTDGGTTWSNLKGGPSDVEGAAVSSTGVYYAVGNGGTSVWAYAGGKWTELLTGSIIHSVAIDPFNANHVVIANTGGNLDQSFDGGKTWSGWNWNPQLSATDIPWLANTGPGMALGGLAFDPKVQGKLWASSGVGVWNTSIPQTMGYNTPIVWKSQSLGIEQLVANDIIVPVGGHPVLASWDRSFFYVNDPNSYPTSYGVAGQPAFAAGWSLDYASSDPSFVVGIADWWGNREESGYSTDGGKDWQVFPTMPPFVGTVIGGSIAASSPTDVIWAPADGAAPYYTLDGGDTWNPVVLPGVTDWSQFDSAYYLDRRTVTADRVLPNTFYMYYLGPTNSGVYRSSDGGVTWTEVFSGQISPGSNFNAKIESVPGEAGNLFFTGGPQDGSGLHEQFFQSKDGGATWTAIANVTEVSCFGFGAAPTPGGYPSVYIVGFVNDVYGVWQSNNDGQSWTQIGQWPEDQLSNIKTISGDPTTYGEVYVGFAGNGYAYLPAVAGVTAVTPSIINGVAGLGKTITLTLQLSAPITISGGVPTLTLNDGGIATYTGGSGTNALTFSYTVAAGQNTPNLTVTAVNLNSARVMDGSGNAGSLDGAVTTPAWSLQIDTTKPTVTAVSDSPVSGIFNAGKAITWSVKFSESVNMNGTPALALSDGGTAVYVGGTGTNTLTFAYTVTAGQNTTNLSVTGVNLGSATVTDAAGNTADFTSLVADGANKASVIQVDTLTPTVSSVTGLTGDMDAGKLVTLTVHLTEAVTVTGGRPQLLLNDGGTANYASGSGTNTLTFSYTVAPGQNTGSLAVVGFNLGAALVRDAAGNAADFSAAAISISGLQIDTTRPTVTSVTDTPVNADLGAGKLVTLTLHVSEVVTVAGGTPTLALNDGGVAKYTGGSGTNALTFSYTVAAGQNTANLGITGVNLNSATVVDGAGNVASLSGALTNPTGTLKVDTTAPTVSFVGATVVSGTTKTVVMTAHFSEVVNVNVASGSPTLTLNNGEIATYTGGSGTNALTFSYVVPTGQSVPSLAVTAFNLNKATIKDAAGNAADLSAAINAKVGTGGVLEISTAYSGAVTFAGATGTLQVDNAATFKGAIAGQMAIGDVIDLPGVTAGAKATVKYSGNNSPGTLTVSDGTHTATIALLGNYSLGNFTVSSDGHGGTLLVDPPLPGQNGGSGSAPTSVDQQLALWSQHLASALPDSAFGGAAGSTMGHMDSKGDQSSLAQPGAGHAQG